jgi:hypothetical protein
MAHLLKYQEWAGSSGQWYCNDVTDLTGLSAKWWAPARILNISLTDFVLLLKKEYHANIVKYNPETDVLIYSWDEQQDAHKFVLFINRMARQANFII